MSLELTVNENMKKAMLAKDEVGLRALRAIKAAVLLAKTAEGATATLSEDTEIKLLQKLVKQRKDSLEIKPSFFQFFKSPNPTYSETWLQNNQNQIQRYYRENGFLKVVVAPKIDTVGKLVNVAFQIQEGDPSYFTKEDSVSVDNPILAEHIKSFLSNNSLINPMQRLQLSLLKKEKEQLSHHLRNEGYYYFSPDAVGIRLNDLKDSTLRHVSLYYKIPEF